MTIHIQIPPELEKELRLEMTDLEKAAAEAAFVGFYRQGKLTHLQLSQALGLDRFETEEVLHRHGVTEDLGTIDDYLSDARILENVRNTGRS